MKRASMAIGLGIAALILWAVVVFMLWGPSPEAEAASLPRRHLVECRWPDGERAFKGEMTGATTNNYGTAGTTTDGVLVQFSPAVPCVLTRR